MDLCDMRLTSCSASSGLAGLSGNPKEILTSSALGSFSTAEGAVGAATASDDSPFDSADISFWFCGEKVRVTSFSQRDCVNHQLTLREGDSFLTALEAGTLF